MIPPRKALFAIGMVGALVFGAPNAFATTYTLDGPVNITDGGGNSITLSGVFLDDLTTANYLAGVAGSDLFVFDVEVTAGDFEQISSSLLIATAVGMGYYSGAQTSPSSGSIVSGAGVFDYSPDLTGDGNLLFLSFNGFFFEGSAQFMVQSFGELIVDGNGTIIEIPPIPEPGTLALSALGLATLAAGSRRRRS